ncbi:protease complex subunit PrcB family protein [Thermodesulfobacteriota bacterium]
MRLSNLALQWIALLISISAGACALGAAGEAGITLDVGLLASPQHCDRPEGAYWIGETNQLHAFFQTINNRVIGGSPLQTDIDFARDGVLLIAMGQQSTAGYSLVLADDQASVDNHTATVNIVWNKPPENQITAQIITSPCLLIKIPKGLFTRIRVVDQKNILRGEIDGL